MSNKLIFSLDVGSSKIVSLVGSLGKQIEILGISSHVNSRLENDFVVTNGNICNIDVVSKRIGQTLREAQYRAECSIGSVISNIAGKYVTNVYSNNRQEVNYHVITPDIIAHMIREAQKVQLPNYVEITDYEVQEYLIDDERYTVNPLNLECSNITANLNFFVAGKSTLANLRKAIESNHYSIAKIVPSGILSGLSILSQDEKNSGCCVIDIGAGVTDVVVYQNGFIRYVVSLPVGSEDITMDIANVLKISRNIAEDLKLTYGSLLASKSSVSNIKYINQRGVEIKTQISLLQGIVNARVNEIMYYIKNILQNNGLYDKINSGIVLTGGGALLHGIEKLSRDVFELPVHIGKPNYAGQFADAVNDPRYSCAVGGLYLANDLIQKSNDNSSEIILEVSSWLGKFKRLLHLN
ncbi:MAG: cell division protein FtsA [Pseudomonadota bacterium]|jgi:cell division protein FtsA